LVFGNLLGRTDRLEIDIWDGVRRGAQRQDKCRKGTAHMCHPYILNAMDIPGLV